ncbi:MAG: JAB domain-containing protein [Treponemataceae bacterium]|nr:JAB domain-containing protein [Treponemataceae bacterium]
MDVRNRFSDAVREAIRRQIIEADGNEVFFSGAINEAGVVVSVTAAARGDAHSVPVNYAEARKGSVLIHNHPSGNLHPSEADLRIASACAENAQGFFIVNNTCLLYT